MAEDVHNTGEEKKFSKAWVFLIFGGLLLVGMSIGATMYFMGFVNSEGQYQPMQEQPASEADSAAATTPLYTTLKPDFIVNFQNKAEAKYLQVSISVLSFDQEVIDAIAKHKPVVRNDLLMLLGTQDPAELRKSEGKDQLRKQVFAALQTIIEEKEGISGIENVFFTSLVMQ